MRIKRAAQSWRKRLQRIETGEQELTQRLIATGQNAFCKPAPHQFPAVAYGICSGGAGIGDNGDRSRKAQSVSQIKGLTLRLIMDDARRLVPMRVRALHSLAVESLAQVHASTGCP